MRKKDPDKISDVRFQINLTPAHHEFLREYSHENRTSMSDVIRGLIDTLMDDRSVMNYKNWR